MTEMTKERDASVCMSCGTKKDEPTPFCTRCQSILPSKSQDYFDFFGLPHRLVLDTASLEKKFYRLSRMLHPDLYARATDQEQQWSLEKSSLLNDAYRTLRDPIARTEYLLKTEGVQMEEQSNQATEAARASGTLKQQLVPPDMLEEVFELNMQLEEARAAQGNGGADPELRAGLETAEKNYLARMRDLQQQLEGLWAQWDDAQQNNDAAAKEDVKQKMVALLHRRNYVRNLVRDVQQALGR